ncbi:MAG: SpoIIE family protein phosphatase, partial [Bacteroidia bacterium]|nr:SpoIIE family protein phosphatase [Bacteroidia bacterium]
MSIRVDITKQKELEERLKHHVYELEEDLLANFHAAQRIQLSLMPALRPEQTEELPVPHFILWQPYHPVSGDFFWSYMEKKRLVLCLGDAMGHGVFGAMLSVMFMQRLHHLTHLSGVWSPEKLAEEAEKIFSQFSHSKADGPITIDSFLGVLDLNRHRLSYTNLKGKAYWVRDGVVEKLHSYPFSF